MFLTIYYFLFIASKARFVSVFNVEGGISMYKSRVSSSALHRLNC